MFGKINLKLIMLEKFFDKISETISDYKLFKDQEKRRIKHIFGLEFSLSWSLINKKQKIKV